MEGESPNDRLVPYFVEDEVKYVPVIVAYMGVAAVVSYLQEQV